MSTLLGRKNQDERHDKEDSLAVFFRSCWVLCDPCFTIIAFHHFVSNSLLHVV